MLVDKSRISSLPTLKSVGRDESCMFGLQDYRHVLGLHTKISAFKRVEEAEITDKNRHEEDTE